MKKVIITLSAFLFVCIRLNAQLTEIELVRTAFRHEKKAEVASFMQLSPSEAKEFWPIYNEYEIKRLDIGDRRIKLLERFATAYKRGDNDAADKLWMQSASIQRAETTLREKYADLVRKNISAKAGLNFYIVEDYINSAVKLQLYNSIPAPKL